MENVDTELRALQRVELTKQIKDIMAQKGITTTLLAEKLGTGEKRLQRILDGRFSERLSVYLDICEAVGCKLKIVSE